MDAIGPGMDRDARIFDQQGGSALLNRGRDRLDDLFQVALGGRFETQQQAGDIIGFERRRDLGQEIGRGTDRGRDEIESGARFGHGWPSWGACRPAYPQGFRRNGDVASRPPGQATSTVIKSWSEIGSPCSSSAAHVLGREAVRPRVKIQSMRLACGGGRPSGMTRRV